MDAAQAPTKAAAKAAQAKGAVPSATSSVVDLTDAYVVAYLISPTNTAADGAAGAAGAVAAAVAPPPSMAAVAKARSAISATWQAVAPAAVQQLIAKLRYELLSNVSLSTLLGGRLPPRAYGRKRTRVVKNSLHPSWHKSFEIRLEGGATSSEGIFDNDEAPFTRLRLEVWDRDSFVFGQVIASDCF